MRIGEAVYTLSTIRRSNRTPRTGGDRVPSPDTSAPSAAAKTGAGAPSTDISADHGGQFHTLTEMFHEHFVEEIRIRDRDGDGQLSRNEYAGAAEEFNLLDADGDGLIGARDLARVALDRNPDLAQIIDGPWTPIYDAILSSPAKDPASLEEAARAGAQETVRREWLGNDDVCPDPEEDAIVSFGREVTGSIAGSGVDNLMTQFLSRHDRLDDLRARLDDLANRMGRTQRYHHIDRTA